ncbi:MAG: SPFH domain-containing protein [Planctomycetota bacterium]
MSNPQIDFSNVNPKKAVASVVAVVLVLVLIFVGAKSYKSVPAGHVAVATLFGKPVTEEYNAGLHFPVNPLLQWVEYDIREKTHKEVASVPSQDQLTTEIDVSVQYNIIGTEASRILSETGTADDAVTVHLIPKLRSLMREQGKTVTRAEEFFLSETQERLTRDIEGQLRDYLDEKGVNVQAVLLRDFRLPSSILANVERKKQAEQEVERQRAELQRQEIEAQKQVVEANAQLEAAEKEAKRRQLIADAQAYEIQKINEAIANNPAYIQLEALKALQAISSDPAAKLYFLNGDSPQPLPLMNLGGDNPITGNR